MNDEIKSILFLCTGNACRSQMAEGFARQVFPKNWKIYSAGVMAAGLHPLTVQAMKELGIDVSDQRSKTVDEIPKEEIDYVVTLCGNAQINCPIFPRSVIQEHWLIEDPLLAIGRLNTQNAFRSVRDDIKQRVEELASRLNK